MIDYHNWKLFYNGCSMQGIYLRSVLMKSKEIRKYTYSCWKTLILIIHESSSVTVTYATTNNTSNYFQKKQKCLTFFSVRPHTKKTKGTQKGKLHTQICMPPLATTFWFPICGTTVKTQCYRDIIYAIKFSIMHKLTMNTTI